MTRLDQIGKQIGIAVIALAAATLAYGQHHPKLAADLEGRDPDTPVNVIIQYRQAPEQRNVDAVVSRGGRHLGTLGVVNGAVYSVPAKALAELADDPEVDLISLDHKLAATSAVDGTATAANLPVNTPDYGWMSLLGLNSPSARAAYDGSGIGVAVIDSGIDASNDFENAYQNASRVVYSKSFVSGDSSTGDAYGHGTHVAGLVGGNGFNSRTFASNYVIRGLAPNVNLLNLRVLDQNGSSTDSVVIAAIQEAIALKSQFNIRVINLSLGRPVASSYATDPLCQAVESAWKAGIVVVVAAGNEGRNNSAGTEGYGTITAPGNDPYVITVGAMNTEGTLARSDDKMTTYSSKGPTLFDHVVKPDLVAPGNRMFSVLAPGSTLALEFPQNIISSSLDNMMSGFGSYYFQLSGTSMATPTVSGAAALLLQQNPNLTPDQVKARLMMTADKTFPAATCPAGKTCTSQAQMMTTATDAVTGVTYTTYYDVFTVGAGYLNAATALANQNTSPLSETALSPTATFNSKSGSVTLVNAANVIWGSNSVFATNVIWGSSVLSGANVIWGTNVIWGSSTTSACNVIWGSNVIWGTGTDATESSAITLEGEK